jgi:hypothetical protein
VAPAVQQRLYSTIGIDYMGGSVDALPPRQAAMALTVQRAVVLRLDGSAQLGKELDEKLRPRPNSRGCELRVIGAVHYDRQKQVITRFDVAGVGRAWGNKMNYVRREVRLDQYPWLYGIACELVTGDAPRTAFRRTTCSTTTRRGRTSAAGSQAWGWLHGDRPPVGQGRRLQ